MKAPEKIYAGPNKPNNATYTPYSECFISKRKGYKSCTRSDIVDKMGELLGEIVSKISYPILANMSIKEYNKWEKEVKDLLNKQSD